MKWKKKESKRSNERIKKTYKMNDNMKEKCTFESYPKERKKKFRFKLQ